MEVKPKSYLDEMPEVNPSSNTDSNVNETSTSPPSGKLNKFDKPPEIAMKVDPKRQSTKIFLVSLGLLQTVKAIGVLLRARRSTRSLRRALAVFLKALIKIERTNIKSSIFFSVYPALYRLLTHRSLRHTSPETQSNPESNTTFLSNAAPALLLGPLANLLPGNILTQLNLYAVCAAGLACARVLDTRVRARLETWESSVERPADQKKEGYVPYFMQPDKHFSFLDQPLSTRQRIELASLAVAKGVWDALSSGGGWWLFPLTQGLLLDTAVFNVDCFPGSYKSVIVSRSKRYLPSAKNLGIPETSTLATALPTPNNLMALLPLFAMPPAPHPSFPLDSGSLLESHTIETQYAPFLPLLRLAQPGHTKAICAALHPMEPSCTVNFLASVRESIGSAFALVGGYSGLMMLLRFKKLKQDPRAALVKWLVSSLRGAGFVTLSISNAWAWVCVFQRLLSPSTLTRARHYRNSSYYSKIYELKCFPRFGLGGILAGLWVLLVPSARRLELGLYSVRLSMLTLWKIGVKKGWWTPRQRLGFAPFAVAMAVLVHVKRQRLAPMEGWVGKGVTWLDADHERLQAESRDVKE